MKTKICFLVIVCSITVCLLTSCAGEKNSVDIYKTEPMIVDVYESKAYRTFIVTIYYTNQYVTKMITDENYILKEGKMDDLKQLSYFMSQHDDNPFFNFDGFTQNLEIDDNSFDLTYAFDYTIIDIKEQIEKGNGLISPEIIDDSFKVEYTKLVESLEKYGLEKDISNEESVNK